MNTKYLTIAITLAILMSIIYGFIFYQEPSSIAVIAFKWVAVVSLAILFIGLAVNRIIINIKERFNK